MAILASDNFEAYTLGDEIGSLANWTSFYNIGQGPSDIAIRNDGPGGSKSAKSESGLWNWADFDVAAANVVDSKVSCRGKSVVGSVILYLRTVGHSAVSARFPSTGYICIFDTNLNKVEIFRMDGNNTTTSLATAFPAAFGADNVFKFQIEGSSMQGFIDGSSVITASNSTHSTAGKPGIASLWNGNNAWFDDFVVEDFGNAATIGRRRGGRR